MTSKNSKVFDRHSLPEPDKVQRSGRLPDKRKQTHKKDNNDPQPVLGTLQIFHHSAFQGGVCASVGLGKPAHSLELANLPEL